MKTFALPSAGALASKRMFLYLQVILVIGLVLLAILQLYLMNKREFSYFSSEKTTSLNNKCSHKSNRVQFFTRICVMICFFHMHNFAYFSRLPETFSRWTQKWFVSGHFTDCADSSSWTFNNETTQSNFFSRKKSQKQYNCRTHSHIASA